MALAELAVLNGLMRRHMLPAGARIVMSDQLADTAYVIQFGVVKVVVEQSDGSELMMAILGPGDVIGALTIGESPDGAHSILPLEDTSLLWIDRHAFERCIQTMPELSANLAGVLGRRIRLANDRIEAMAGIDVRTRIVRHLLLLAREYGEVIEDGDGQCVRIPLRFTQADLARLVGASRVRVNHALSELRRREVVQMDDNQKLRIRNMAALEKLR
ncbi:Crp/Fnr family transcriptional regulator [Mycobacterium sp. pV006]|uniref:Crp/Fnr family transcriptional regulator n=1 Tax=Mycobacterium sp. pV006 TaxID=3238983 RepID=UPI00351B5ED3